MKASTGRTVGFAFLVILAALSAPATARSQTTMTPTVLDAIRPYSVTLSVADLEAAARWYRDKLGFVEVQRKRYPEFSTELAFLEKNGYRVELIRDGNAREGMRRSDPPAHTAAFGVSQFAFQTDDLAAVRAELERRSVPIVWSFENAELGARFLFIRDPDGNLIQFLQRMR